MKAGGIPKRVRPIVVGLGLVIGTGAGAAILHGWKAPAAPARSPALARPATAAPRVLATLPGFALEDERGGAIGLDDLRGTVWVADFIFTRCVGTCPMITRRMAALAQELASSPSLGEVMFVSLSVDPEFDRPDVLREYGRANGADPARWKFVTGTRDTMRRIVREGFRLPVGDQDDPAMPIYHSQSFVVVDRAGRVRGAYDGLTDDGLADLRGTLAQVVAEPPPTDLLVPADAGDPRWIAERRTAQAAADTTIAAPHRFRFKDRLGASGMTFRCDASLDLGKYYRPTHYDHGAAVAAADIDGDRLPDLYFANQAGRNSLYRNAGGGRFLDITDQAGVGIGDRACVGAAFADIDNDGDPDLFVTSIREGNVLFRNDGHGAFTDISAQAGVEGHGEHSSGAVFFDYDGDGWLDLFVTNVGRYTEDERRPNGLWMSVLDSFAGHLHAERAEASILYRNLGGARFEEASQSTGLVHSAWSGDATVFDDDADGLPDLYVASMQGHDELWRHLGGGRFEKRGREVFPSSPWGSMGVKVLDWNGDGLLDLFVTDMHTDMASELRPEDERRKHDPRTMFPARFLGTDGNHILGNALYSNQGGGRFTDVSDLANVETGWPWGPSVGDLNADGWPDLLVAAGMNYPFRYHGNDVLLNEAGRRFANAEFLLGVEPRERMVRPWFELDCDGPDAPHDICQGEGAPRTLGDGRSAAERGKGDARHGRVTVWAARASRSAVILDLEGDGDLDVITSNYGDVPQVLVSDLAQRGPVRHLEVRLIGRRSNRDGLGAVVSLQAEGRTQVQVNDGKSGYLAQSGLPLYFGLGGAAQADSLTVRWPTGRVQVMRGPLRPGATIVVKEPAG